MLRVLIADDVRSVRERLKEILSSLKFVEVVAEAESAAEAIDLINTTHTDVAILDINMPGSGIQVLDHIHQHSKDTIVVMLSNYADEFFRTMCLKKGASFFLDKSLEFGKVQHILQKVYMSVA